MVALDLDQQATVRWTKARQQGQYSRGEPPRYFDTVREAIRYVMEEVPAEYRGSACIYYEGGLLEIADIEAEYAKLAL